MTPPAGARVVVLGGTGMQGGSVVDHLLKAGTALRLRVPTRDPSSEAACKLRKRGVEVVQADLSKAEHLSAVFADAWAVFAVTTPTWDPATVPSEQQQGIALAEAAKATGVQVYIWSSLPDVERLSGGKLKCVPHFTMKARVWEAVQKLGFPVACTLEAASYYQNADLFPVLLEYQKQEDGSSVVLSTLNLTAEDTLLGYDVADTGLPVVAILQNPEVVNGKRIGFTSTWDKTLREYMEGFERVVGKPVRLHVRQPDDSIPKPLVEVIEWLKGWSYFGGQELVDAQSLVQQRFMSWDDFLIKENWKAHF